MKRYKGLDIIRGLCMMIMLIAHLANWWLIPEDQGVFEAFASVFAPIGASGFVITSGTVTIISYRNKLINTNASDKLYLLKIRNMYFLRAIFLIIISICINIVVVMMYREIHHLWTWHILQTIGFTLVLTWPFIKTSKAFRIAFAIAVLILNQIILKFLIDFQGAPNYYGLLYYLFYNPIRQYPIIPYFAIFLLGTVIGEFLFDINQIKDPIERARVIKARFIIPLFISGLTILSFGILYLFPSFLYWTTISASLYSIGIIFMLISILIGFEEFKVFKFKRRYRFFFFYSYYSFTIYFGHIFLTFIFYHQLNAVNVWIPIIITLVLMTILLKLAYNKLGPKLSISAGLTLASFFIATQLYNRKKRKIIINPAFLIKNF